MSHPNQVQLMVLVNPMKFPVVSLMYQNSQIQEKHACKANKSRLQ